jgi:hypothetical protein
VVGYTVKMAFEIVGGWLSDVQLLLAVEWLRLGDSFRRNVVAIKSRYLVLIEKFATIGVLMLRGC